MKKIVFITTILLAVIGSIAFASAFQYYPTYITLSPVAPPVTFDNGKNANQPDLGPTNTITVTLGANKTSLSITIHPTYQTAYYKNTTIIINTDTKAYNIYMRVTTPATLPAGSSATIYVYNKGATRTLTGFPTPAPSGEYIATVSLLTTGTTLIGSLSASGVYEIDIYTVIPEGVTLPAQTTANVLLIYTPSGETPP
ncbi:MAG: hypothetical protein ACP5IZ_09165 [Thermoprotei archaeon]